MDISGQRLSTKLVWIAVTFLLVALTAIGFTLLESWKLEGGAASINDLGSERMRSYRIAYLLSEFHRDPSHEVREKLLSEMRRMEEILILIKRGDPARPLLLPRDPNIAAEVEAVQAQWLTHIKPNVSRILQEADPRAAQVMLRDFRGDIEAIVARIDGTVRTVEEHNSGTITLLRFMQFGLIAAALAGTVTMIYLMFLLVVRPVATLKEGMQRMTAGEFGTRLPVETSDEFGALADGFNRMASRLQDLYVTLEERVADKTRDVEARNRELAALYEVARLLNEPAATEELCRSFLRRLMVLHGAAGGAVRLVDSDTRSLHLYAHEGLSAAFALEERCVNMGECLCGVAAQTNCSAVDVLDDMAPDVAVDCRMAGYRTVAVFPIRLKRDLLGIFNLYFTAPHTISRDDRQLLETLGQHLGVAIENQRLASRARELAVYEERSLIARELHDSIAQSLAFLNIQVQMLEDSLSRDARGEVAEVLGHIREGVQESYDDVRELLTHFRSRVPQEEDIGLALQNMLARFGARSGLATKFSDRGTGVPLHAESQLQVLHILQEALSNVRKHAGADMVELEIERGNLCRFRVRDNGHGFDQGRLADKSESHIGLRIMRERAHRIGGVLEVTSRPSGGTQVTLTLPVAQREAA